MAAIFEKYIWRHNSARGGPISMKFETDAEWIGNTYVACKLETNRCQDVR